MARFAYTKERVAQLMKREGPGRGLHPLRVTSAEWSAIDEQQPYEELRIGLRILSDPDNAESMVGPLVSRRLKIWPAEGFEDVSLPSYIVEEAVQFFAAAGLGKAMPVPLKEGNKTVGYTFDGEEISMGDRDDAVAAAVMSMVEAAKDLDGDPSSLVGTMVCAEINYKPGKDFPLFKWLPDLDTENVEWSTEITYKGEGTPRKTEDKTATKKGGASKVTASKAQARRR